MDRAGVFSGEPVDGGAVSKYLVQASWEDCPHLDKQAKEELMAAYPPYQRDARTKGIPQLGSGAIYQVPESDILVADFEVPEYYLKAYGMDVGWNRTAAVWGAKDRESGAIYLYSEHYRGQAEPVVHAMAIQSRGKWIPGVIDPAAAGRSQKDGIQLLMQYREMGLDLQPALNAVEAGIYAVWQLLSVGKLKVFKSLGNWITEFRLYQRDTEGRVVKQNDHLMDATRYLIMSGIDRAKASPARLPRAPVYSYGTQPQAWMELFAYVVLGLFGAAVSFLSTHA